jgi:hypothetical protein
MSIIITKNPDEYSFVGNPVLIELQTDSDAIIQMDIITGDQTHQTSYYPYRVSDDKYAVKADISDYLKFQPTSFVPENTETVDSLPDFSRPYHVDIRERESNETLQVEGHVFYGGINNGALRILAEKGYNMFSYRLSFYYGNFLFTTRTNSSEIKIRKTELFPFVFIHPGNPIVFRSGTGESLETDAFPAGTVCTMDIQKVLERFPPGTNRVEVYYQGEFAFCFAIRREVVSAEKYFIRFRNSLGAFEMLEVSGRAAHAPEFSEESLHETLTDFDFYEERRSRVEHRNIVKVETGHKMRSDFPFITDMIKSDEIYFIYPDGYSFRCHVTAEGVEYRNLMTEPTSIKLQVREVTKEQYAIPPVDFDFDRIFNETFDETFN